jgi:general secretion pathway protein A
MELPYLEFFDLKEEPFSTVPSPRSLFLTSVHATALEKTAYVVGAKKGLAVVFGDTGMGKSSLARLLHQKFLDNEFVSVLLTNPNYPTPNSLLRTIAQEFRTPKTDKSFKGMLDIFKEFLYKTAIDDKKTVALIIDEAQTLRLPLIELLRQLSNYETNDQKLLQLVLFSQDDLRTRLAHPRGRSFRSRIVMASTLDPLSPKETEGMIAFRWNVASGGATHPFQPDALTLIFEASQGIPREACIIADNSLLLAYYDKAKKISKSVVQRVVSDRQSTLKLEKEASHASA